MKNTVPVTAESVDVRKAFAGDRDEMLKLAKTIKSATWLDVCGTPEPSPVALQSQFLAERGECEMRQHEAIGQPIIDDDRITLRSRRA